MQRQPCSLTKASAVVELIYLSTKSYEFDVKSHILAHVLNSCPLN
jgi:hypothetical protein